MKTSDYLFRFCRKTNNTIIKKITNTNNINRKKSGIIKPTQTKNKATTTTINVSRNSFSPNGLPDSSFILTHDYLVFFKYLLPKIYTIRKITINTISIIFVGVLIPFFKINILKSNIRTKRKKYAVKTTASNCSLVLITTGIIGNKIPNNKYLLFYFNSFGGLNNVM